MQQNQQWHGRLGNCMLNHMPAPSGQSAAIRAVRHRVLPGTPAKARQLNIIPKGRQYKAPVWTCGSRLEVRHGG